MGFDTSDSFALALGSQLPDEVEILDARASAKNLVLDMANPFKNSEGATAVVALGHAALHALTGGVSVLETDRAVAGVGGARSLVEAGIQLHRLGDSFAHRQLGNENFLYSVGPGHGRHLTFPDLIQKRPNLYLNYVRTVETALGSLDPGRRRHGRAASVTADLAEMARAPFSIFDSASAESRSVERLRQMVLEEGLRSGKGSEVARLLRFRPETHEGEGATVEEFLNAVRSTAGVESVPAGFDPSAVSVAVFWSIELYYAQRPH